ncbi:MAG: flagellar biosynthesis anti-sigma factor FlgM [Lachnospiraceae bacterium]|nr:flagellar biosynthesis anti-sigma factor FlgM [Lachnospiraceae bacterium]
MRIEAYTQVQQLYQPKKVNNAKTTATASKRDQVEISGFGKEIQLAKQAVSASPDVRSDKVEAIKSQMEAGTYSVSTSALADKLLDGIYGNV